MKSSQNKVRRILESLLTTFTLSGPAIYRGRKNDHEEGLYFLGKEIAGTFSYQSLRYLSLDTREGCCTLIMRDSQLVGIEVYLPEILTSSEVEALEPLAVQVIQGFDRFERDDPRPYGTDNIYNF